MARRQSGDAGADSGGSLGLSELGRPSGAAWDVWRGGLGVTVWRGSLGALRGALSARSADASTPLPMTSPPAPDGGGQRWLPGFCRAQGSHLHSRPAAAGLLPVSTTGVSVAIGCSRSGWALYCTLQATAMRFSRLWAWKDTNLVLETESSKGPELDPKGGGWERNGTTGATATASARPNAGERCPISTSLLSIVPKILGTCTIRITNYNPLLLFVLELSP